MSTIERVRKTGGTNKFHTEWELGFTEVKASEVDADLDIIVDAWNTQIPNAVLSSGAPPSGPATGDLTGTYPAPVIGPGKVTRAQAAADCWLSPVPIGGDVGKVLGVTVGPVLGWVSGPAPTGAAGGDLAGNYPNPTLKPTVMPGTAVTGLTPVESPKIWRDVRRQVTTNPPSGTYLLDARSLVLVDGHSYRLTCAGDASRCAGVNASIVPAVGNVSLPTYLIGGVIGSSRNEFFIIEIIIRVEGSSWRVSLKYIQTANVTNNTTVWPTTVSICSKTIPVNGTGFALTPSWELPDPSNYANSYVGMVECM